LVKTEDVGSENQVKDYSPADVAQEAESSGLYGASAGRNVSTSTQTNPHRPSKKSMLFETHLEREIRE
jgi:hypothetical protein